VPRNFKKTVVLLGFMDLIDRPHAIRAAMKLRLAVAVRAAS